MAEEKKCDGLAAGVAAQLARPNILSLLPYRCARDDYDSGVLLDANENSLGPAAVAQDNHLVLERYPSPYQTPLKELYCKAKNVPDITPANVFVGVGSDEAIDLLFRIFCVPAVDNVLITPPTYGMYKVCAAINDVEVVKCGLSPDFDLRVPETLEAITPKTKMVFICTPGNPTSKCIPLSDIEKIATSYKHGIVVVDEAYVDFCTQSSAATLIGRYPNVVVLQTLSKAFGLAGIRCGFCVAAPDIIQLMNNVKAPYNVNSLTSEVAQKALLPEGLTTFKANVDKLLQQRNVVKEGLEKLDFVVQVFPSDSNFILFRVKDSAEQLYKTMAENGVVSRFRGRELHCSECIRVSIGTEEENVKFLQLLEKTWADLHP